MIDMIALAVALHGVDESALEAAAARLLRPLRRARAPPQPGPGKRAAPGPMCGPLAAVVNVEVCMALDRLAKKPVCC